MGDGKFIRVNGFVFSIATTTPSKVEVGMMKWRGSFASDGIAVVHCSGAGWRRWAAEELVHGSWSISNFVSVCFNAGSLRQRDFSRGQSLIRGPAPLQIRRIWTLPCATYVGINISTSRSNSVVFRRDNNIVLFRRLPRKLRSSCDSTMPTMTMEADGSIVVVGSTKVSVNKDITVVISN